MAQLSFSYFPFDNFDSETKTKTGVVFKPFITIRIQANHGPLSLPIDALVDSGSDRNLFPMEFATQFLNLNFKKANRKIIRGIGEAKIVAYPGQFKIWVNNNVFDTDADFSPEHKIPILGREGFFSLFRKVSFDEGGRFIELDLK